MGLKSKIQEFKINMLTDFLAEYSFLDTNKKDKKARLAQVFVEFLEENSATIKRYTDNSASKLR